MPVTARLSKQFYDRLGEQVANELVEWFNQVDTQYRSDLRDLNEQNFARFDAKVEQRFAESDARFEKRLLELDVRFEKRLAELEVRMEKRFAEFEKRFAEFETRIERRLGAIEAGIAQQFLAQTRFLYVSLVAQMALLAGLYLR